MTAVLRREATDASFQGAAVKALISTPELLRALLLHEDESGALTVQHIAADALAALVNAGQLPLVCEWLSRALDDFLRYLNAGKTKSVSYPEFIGQISHPDAKTV